MFTQVRVLRPKSGSRFKPQLKNIKFVPFNQEQVEQVIELTSSARLH
jgi:hypothetical protein